MERAVEHSTWRGPGSGEVGRPEGETGAGLAVAPEILWGRWAGIPGSRNSG
jgi:hypothetical protein